MLRRIFTLTSIALLAIALIAPGAAWTDKDKKEKEENHERDDDRGGRRGLAHRVAALEQALGAFLNLVRYCNLRVVAADHDPNNEADAPGTGAINGLAGPHLIIEGCNVHVRSGSGATDDNDPGDGSALTGLGNLVVGYNEPRPLRGRPDLTRRGGAHNLIVGPWNKYSSVGGLVAGRGNTVSGPNASVSGGSFNHASGIAASISGGNSNTASGEDASVNGGDSNSASGPRASVSGGRQNTASGGSASVSGGTLNTASGTVASVSGGFQNEASGNSASVSGGDSNTASGHLASVSGGQGNTADCIFPDLACTVGGGLNRTESRDKGWRAGDQVANP